MPVIIKKEELPENIPYLTTKVKDEIVFYAPINNGTIFFFPALDQVRFVTYKELAEYVAGAEVREPEPVVIDPKKPRPVHGPTVQAGKDQPGQ